MVLDALDSQARITAERVGLYTAEVAVGAATFLILPLISGIVGSFIMTAGRRQTLDQQEDSARKQREILERFQKYCEPDLGKMQETVAPFFRRIVPGEKKTEDEIVAWVNEKQEELAFHHRRAFR